MDVCFWLKSERWKINLAVWCGWLCVIIVRANCFSLRYLHLLSSSCTHTHIHIHTLPKRNIKKNFYSISQFLSLLWLFSVQCTYYIDGYIIINIHPFCHHHHHSRRLRCCMLTKFFIQIFRLSHFVLCFRLFHRIQISEHRMNQKTEKQRTRIQRTKVGKESESQSLLEYCWCSVAVTQAILFALYVWYISHSNILNENYKCDLSIFYRISPFRHSFTIYAKAPFSLSYLPFPIYLSRSHYF